MSPHRSTPDPESPTSTPRSTRSDFELYALALRGAGSFAGKRVVDVGCGRGALLRVLAGQGAHAIGVEVDHEDLRIAVRVGEGPARSGEVRVVEADAHALPFGDSSVAAVTCFLVAHYLRNPGRALSEIRRVLEPGGLLILADRVTDAEASIREGRDAIERKRSRGFQRLLASGELRALCEASGFEFLAEESYEKRLPMRDWLAAIPEHEQSRAVSGLEAWIHAARPRTLRIEAGDVVIAETIIRCRVRGAASR